MNKNKGIISYSPALAIPAILVYTAFTIIPLAMSLFYSFTDWNMMRWDNFSFVGLRNYLTIPTDDVFVTSLRNTLIFGFSTAFLKILFGLSLALLLQRTFRGSSIFRTIFYLPCVISSTVIGVLFTSILSVEGMLNNVMGFLGLDFLQLEWLGSYGTAMLWVILVESWMWAGFNMFIFISGLQAISDDYYEAANIEGASKIKQFTKITLPLLAPAITVNITLNISGGMRVFDIIYVLTNGGPGTDTQVLSTYAFRAFSMGYLGEASAASVILSVLVIVVAFTLNKLSRNMEVEL